MPSFRTQYDPSVKTPADPGSRIKTQYSPFFTKDGVMELRPTGKINLYDEIQSHADSVDIHILLARYAAGDVGVFARVQGAYGDFTQMPQTFAEALNVLSAAEQYFMGLPPETRALFGHSFNQFIASMDQSDWTSKVGLDLPDLPGSAPAESPAAPAAPAESPAAPAPSSP